MDLCAVACDSGCLRKRCSAVRLTLVTTRFRGAGLHAQVAALLVSGLYLAAACCVAVTACGLLAMAGRLPRFVPTLCGPSVAFLVGRLSANIVVRCFGRLDRCATLAYELCLTCDCREAPRCSAADSRRQCPFSLAGLMLALLMGVCMLLPVPWEVAFVTCFLRCVHHPGVTHRLWSTCGVASWYGLIGLHYQGHLTCVLGLGWSSCYRMRLLWQPIPLKVGTFETKTAGMTEALCKSRVRFVQKDVLPG